MRRLHLRLFGPFAVTLDETAVTAFEALSARALLAYLAVGRGQSYSRASLATLLWGPDADATGLTNLRSCLRRLRGALGDGEGAAPFLQVVQDTVQFDPQADLWLDVQRFEALLAEVTAHPHRRVQDCPWCVARLAEAVALYRGPFLAGLPLDSLFFEEWQQLQQERYHRQAMQALYLLADYYLRRGALVPAEQYARRQLALESWNEEAHVQLMRILAASGQRSAALAQYARCRAILAAELDVAPMPATTALYEELRTNGAVDAGAAFSPAVGRSLPGPNNLPQPATELVDRTDEIDWLLHRLVAPTHRLTSLVGEGGVGKTRLALAVAQRLAGSFADGIWFVSLVDINGNSHAGQMGREVTAAIAAALGLPLNERLDPQRQLFAFLRTKELMLVLDNCEHLLPAAAMVGDLLRAAPSVVILVTSRQPLNLQAEHVIRLSGLALPAAVDDPATAAYPAVVLFDARARQCQPHFTLTPESLPAVVQICRLVHGLPLGIELAAAWVRHRTLDEIAAGLAQQAEWLHSNRPDIHPRHRTMQAVFDHSWALLSPAEQAVLVSTVVFRGGFDRAAAAAVLQANAAHLATLVDKSLLHQDSAGRYEMHELLRQFVGRRLEREAQAEVSANHARYYLDLLRRHEGDLRGHAMDRALALARTEVENIRLAWTWASEHGAFDLLAASACAFRSVCTMLGLWQEGAQLLEEAARATAAHPPAGRNNPTDETLATLLIELAELYYNYSDPTLLAAVAEQLIRLGRRRALLQARTAGHLALGKAYIVQAQLTRARRRLTLALRLAQQSDLANLEAATLSALGHLAHLQGEKAHAQRLFEAALAHYRHLGLRLEEANTLSALSQVYHNDPAKVYRFTQQRLEVARRAGSAVDEVRALHRLTILWLNVGEYARSRECCQQALRLVERMNSPHNALLFLDFLGLTYHYLGDDITALHYLDQTVQLSKTTGDQRALAYALHWSGQVLLARGELGNAADCYAQAADIRLLHHQPHLAFQSQAGLARVRLAQGHKAAALQLVNPIVAQLDELRRQDVEDPCLLWLNCLLVLQASCDVRAGAVLDQAHEIVQERAARISDPALRESFLHKISVHAQIVTAWQAASSSHSVSGPTPKKSRPLGLVQHQLRPSGATPILASSPVP